MFIIKHLENIEITDYSVSNGHSYGTNFLGMLVFCLTFGSIISGMGEKGRDLHNFFDNLSKAFFQIINIVIWYGYMNSFKPLSINNYYNDDN